MIYAVLVNWKGYDDTIECLESLARLRGTGCKVIIVDNQSAADGVARIADWAEGRTGVDMSSEAWSCFESARTAIPGLRVIPKGADFQAADAPFATVIANPENSGFAGGCNIGINAALSDPACDFIWLLNNDTVVEPTALRCLERAARADAAVGICGSTLIYYDSPQTIQSLGGRFNKYLGRIENVGEGIPRSRLAGDANAFVADYMCAASILVSRRFIEEIGPLSEDYFLYFEELDWEARNGNRFKTIWAKDSIVYHKEGKSIGTNTRGRPSDTTLYYYNVNFLRFTRKFNAVCLPVALLKVMAVAASFGIRSDLSGSRMVRLALKDFMTGETRRGPLLPY